MRLEGDGEDAHEAVPRDLREPFGGVDDLLVDGGHVAHGSVGQRFLEGVGALPHVAGTEAAMLAGGVAQDRSS